MLNSFQTNIHLVVICPPEHTKDNEPSYDKPVRAIAMLMGLAPGDFVTKVAANCHWHGITKVTVQVRFPPMVSNSYSDSFFYLIAPCSQWLMLQWIVKCKERNRCTVESIPWCRCTSAIGMCTASSNNKSRGLYPERTQKRTHIAVTKRINNRTLSNIPATHTLRALQQRLAAR